MGIKERKLKEKELRIKQIRDSAATLFYKKGYESTTIEDIAKLAEISKGTIYLYFKSKIDLYYSMVEPSLDVLSKKLSKIAGMKKISPEAKIKKVTDATYEFYVKDPDAYHLISRYEASVFSNLLSQRKLDHLKHLMRSNLNQLEVIVSEGIKLGYFRKLNPKMTAIVFWNTFMGIIQFQENRLEKGKIDYRRSTINSAMELIIRGIRK